MKCQPDWTIIRSVYAKGEGSLRDLATRFSVPIRTLERRCSREGWARVVAVADGTMAATAAETAAKAGHDLGNAAAAFVARNIALTDELLDELHNLIHAGPPLTPAALRQLTAALRELNEVGREAYGLNASHQTDASSWGRSGNAGNRPIIDITPVRLPDFPLIANSLNNSDETSASLFPSQS